MKYSFAVGGGLGDYILRYLGFPGNRLAAIHKLCPNEIQLRVSKLTHPGLDLFNYNPYFADALVYDEDDVENWPKNQVDHIENILSFPKQSPRLVLDAQEHSTFLSIKKPYAVFHPFASGQFRSLDLAFNTHRMSQWVADVSSMPVVVLGQEDFGYKSDNVRHVKGSVRLSVRIVEGASFFVGTHSSMLCAAWVYDVPSFCVGPSNLLFHNIYAPRGHYRYLKPMFSNGNHFMMYDQGQRFPYFLDHFLKEATSIKPASPPEACRQRISLFDSALATPLENRQVHSLEAMRQPIKS